MTHDIFQFCVDILVWMGSCVGLSYEAINVLLFCFLLPLFMLLWGVYTLYLAYKAKRRDEDVKFRNALIMLVLYRVGNAAETLEPSDALWVASCEVESQLTDEERITALNAVGLPFTPRLNK